MKLTSEEQKIYQDARNSLSLDFYNGTNLTRLYVEKIIQRKKDMQSFVNDCDTILRMYEKAITDNAKSPKL